MSVPDTSLTPLIVGVTSHRNLAVDDIESLRLVVREFLTGLRRDFAELPLVVMSALAEGGDQLVAREALDVGARLITPLPLPIDSYTEDFSSTRSRAEFAELCAQAKVIQLPLLPRNTPEGVAAPGSQRDAQYAEAGVYIASHSHILLALWDGRESDLLGGTAQIVRYYLDGILPGSIERRSGARPLLDRGDESLLFHIACSRDNGIQKGMPPQAPLQNLQARWLSQSRSHPAQEGMPKEFRLVFRRMVQFNKDTRRYCEADAAAIPMSGNSATTSDDGPIERMFAAADHLAMHFQRRVLLAMRGIHMLAALMGIAFICYSDIPSDWSTCPT